MCKETFQIYLPSMFRTFVHVTDSLMPLIDLHRTFHGLISQTSFPLFNTTTDWPRLIANEIAVCQDCLERSRSFYEMKLSDWLEFRNATLAMFFISSKTIELETILRPKKRIYLYRFDRADWFQLFSQFHWEKCRHVLTKLSFNLQDFVMGVPVGYWSRRVTI